MVEILKIDKAIFIRKTCTESYNLPRQDSLVGSGIRFYSDNGTSNCYHGYDLYVPTSTSKVVTVNYNYGGNIINLIEVLSSGGMEIRYKELDSGVVFVKELGRGYEVGESSFKSVRQKDLIEVLRKDVKIINF